MQKFEKSLLEYGMEKNTKYKNEGFLSTILRKEFRALYGIRKIWKTMLT